MTAPLDIAALVVASTELERLLRLEDEKRYFGLELDFTAFFGESPPIGLFTVYDTYGTSESEQTLS